MDPLQSFLALGVVFSPLFAALAICAAGFRRRGALGPRIAQLGAAVAFGCAAAALFRTLFGSVPGDAPLVLGSWLFIGPEDALRITFGVKLDVSAAALATAMSLAATCALAWHPPTHDDGKTDRTFAAGAALLLFSSIGVVASTSFGAFFVCWQIAGASAYVMLSAYAASGARSAGAKKVFLIQRIGDVLLLCAVLALAVGFRSLEWNELFGNPEAWDQNATREAALVNLLALCVLGACVCRCALFPVLSWIDDLATAPASVAALIQGACLMPCGVVLLIRFLPVLNAAPETSLLAAFVGGLSAILAALCAFATNNRRRTLGSAFAGVFGLLLHTLSRASPAVATPATFVLVVYILAATLILSHFGRGEGASSARPLELPRWPLQRLARNGFYLDDVLFLFVLIPIRGIAQFARFLDWFLVDGVVAGAPTSLIEAGQGVFGPIQHRRTPFYAVSAVWGAVLLALVIVWLRS